MNRALRFLVRNWPLKLGAIGLAILLYGAQTLSQSSRTFDGSVPVQDVNTSRNVVILSDLGVVSQIRYFASSDVGRLDASSFRATVDLAEVSGGSQRVSLPIQVEAIDPRIQVLDFSPRRVNVEIDSVVTRLVPINVDRGTIPDGLDVREPVLSITEATVRGPEGVVNRVSAALARVRIDASGLDINKDIELIPVDELGQPLALVDVEPATVRVKIAVFTNRQTRSLPVNPVVTGTPAAGWEIESVSVTPAILTVEGDADQLAPLDKLDTTPVSVSGATAQVRATVELDLPVGVLPLGDGQVQVTVTLREVTGSRSFSVGLALVGTDPQYTYGVAPDQVLITVGGPLGALDAVAADQLVAQIDVAGVGPGAAQLGYTVALPPGVTLVAGSPQQVTVTVVQVATPGPSPTATTLP
jgi:YbbR domain-containing protein